MIESKYRTAPVSCPSCHYRFVAPVLTVLDGGRDPEVKTLFLSGQLNIAVCPQCGRAGMLSTPLVYHDAEKELLLTFVPPTMGISEAEQQRIVGDLINRVIASLPPERRKGYLLSPRRFFRLDGLIEAVLEADGITREVLDAQRQRAELLDRLLHASDEEARRVIAQENDANIDDDFFQLLALYLELAEARGPTGAEGQLLVLREQLLQWTTAGRDIRAREEAIRSLGREVTREGLLEKLIEAARADEPVKVETMVALGRPVIDYLFYQQLTERIRAAERVGDSKEAHALTSLRHTVLDLTAQIDAELRQATEEAARFLQRLIESDDPEADMRSQPQKVDDLFMEVLAANLRAVQESGPPEARARLERVRDAVMKLIEESQPPEVQLINRLLGAEYPGGTQAILEEHRQEVTEQLLQIMASLSQDLAQRGRHEMAERLRQIQTQAQDLAG